MIFYEFLMAMDFAKAAERCNNPITEVTDSAHTL